jgi:hypothetical protein
MKPSTHFTLLLTLAITLGSGSSIAAPKSKADLAPKIQLFNAGNVNVMNSGKAYAGIDISESSKTNSKAYIIKTVSKPIDSFASKSKPTKPLRKAINAHAINVSPTVNLFANGPGKADLTIKPVYQNNTAPEGYPGQSYCERPITGGTAKNIWFYVKNIGNATAAPSTLKVFFNTFQVGGGQMSQYNKKLPSIAKGQSKIIKVSLPQGCYPGNYNSSCYFRIFVDTDFQVNENNEGNNYIDSKCVSPAD